MIRFAATSLHPSLLAARMEHALEPAPLRQLTSKLAAGDDAAWSEFHQLFGPRIFRQLLAATRGNHALAAEALQQTYLRVARHARPCDQIGTFCAWLRVVARTALSDCRRRQMSFWQLLRRRRDDPGEFELAENVAGETRLQAALDTALARISADDRALLEGKYLDGRDVRSLAAELGISAKAAESRLTRARQALREELGRQLSCHE